METFLKINIKVLAIVVIMLVVDQDAYPQTTLTNKVVDTEPIELYIELVNSIKQNGKPDDFLVKKYFNNPTNAFFKQRPGFDSLNFVKNLIAVYSVNAKDNALLKKDDDYYLMLKYKENEKIIKESVKAIKKSNIPDRVKTRLRPFYDKSLNVDSFSIKYIYLFLNEGNGGFPGYVFNSSLQTAYLDPDIIDIVSAHEAYHTVTNSIFMNKFSRVFNDPASKDSEKNLLWYLEIIAEEGIADLIDKPTLTVRKSPLSFELKQLRINEESRSKQKIFQLDSLLSSSNAEKRNFSDVSKLLENGGHIPGRYMAIKIKDANLKDYLKYTGNPFQFIYHYNIAVKNVKEAAKFSKKSIDLLNKIELDLLSRK